MWEGASCYRMMQAPEWRLGRIHPTNGAMKAHSPSVIMQRR